jgi:hypothetical protein
MSSSGGARVDTRHVLIGGIAVLEVAFDIAVVEVVDNWRGEPYTDYLPLL